MGYQFRNAAFVPGDSFAFTVDIGGNVIDITNTAAASAVDSTLMLNNATISIDPGSYLGRYELAGSFPGSFTGVQPFVVVPNMGYQFRNAAFAPGGGLAFKVDPNGLVTTITNTSAASASGSVLMLNTATINVNPGSYTGRYELAGSFPGTFTGVQPFVVVSNLGYQFRNAASAPGGGFFFKVEANGDVTTITNTDAASASGSTLTLKTTTINIDPGDYDGRYELAGSFSGFFAGVQPFVVVSNLGYSFETQRPLRVTVSSSGSRLTGPSRASRTPPRPSHSE